MSVPLLESAPFVADWLVTVAAATAGGWWALRVADAPPGPRWLELVASMPHHVRLTTAIMVGGAGAALAVADASPALFACLLAALADAAWRHRTRLAAAFAVAAGIGEERVTAVAVSAAVALRLTARIQKPAYRAAAAVAVGAVLVVALA